MGEQPFMFSPLYDGRTPGDHKYYSESDLNNGLVQIEDMGTRITDNGLEMKIRLNVDPTTVPGETLNKLIETSPEITSSVIKIFGDDENGPFIRFYTKIPNQREY